VEERSGSLGSLRRSNRARVVRAMSAAGISSRAGIARRTGLSRSTVSNIVAELQDEGLVVAREANGNAPARSGGRPPNLISLDPTAGLAVGIDLGKRHLAVAVADLAHNVLAEERRELDELSDANGAMEAAAALLDRVLAEGGADRSRIVGVGMGLPGPVHTSGAVGSSAILPGWAGISAAEDMESRLGLPVRVSNDANLGALAEHVWGAGRGCSNMTYLKLSTGVGAGIIMDSRLWGGAGGTAGEIGHMTVDETGQICRCGNRGCLETFAGAPAILEPLSRSLGEDLEIEDVITRARDGDPGCRRVLEDAGRRVGVAVANLCNLVNPERIVVGGSVGMAGEVILEPLRDSVRLRAIPSAAEDVEIVNGELGERAELLGAVALVLREASLAVPGLERTPAQ
jgi:predicted NBD/HSP70 family sugar kinase